MYKMISKLCRVPNFTRKDKEYMSKIHMFVDLLQYTLSLRCPLTVNNKTIISAPVLCFSYCTTRILYFYNCIIYYLIKVLYVLSCDIEINRRIYNINQYVQVSLGSVQWYFFLHKLFIHMERVRNNLHTQVTYCASISLLISSNFFPFLALTFPLTQILLYRTKYVCNFSIPT